jgi:hypothetical protein
MYNSHNIYIVHNRIGDSETINIAVMKFCMAIVEGPRYSA